MYIHSPPTSIEHSLSNLRIYLSLRTDTYTEEHPSTHTVDSSPFGSNDAKLIQQRIEVMMSQKLNLLNYGIGWHIRKE